LKFRNSGSVLGHVAGMGDRRDAYRVLVGRPKEGDHL